VLSLRCCRVVRWRQRIHAPCLALAIGALTALAAHKTREWSLDRIALRLCRWCGIGIVLTTFWFTQDALKAMVWGPEFVGFGAAIYLFGSTDRIRPREFVVFTIPQLFGRLSYEVYLFHMFFLVGIGHINNIGMRTEANSVQFDASVFAGYLLILAVLLMGISRFYSEPTNRLIRSWHKGRSDATAPVDDFSRAKA